MSSNGKVRRWLSSFAFINKIEGGGINEIYACDYIVQLQQQQRSYY